MKPKSFKQKFEALFLCTYENKSQVEAALIVGVHKSTVCRWLKRYSLQLPKKGKKIFLPKTPHYTPEMDIYIKKHF